ncbi:hypothetical protein VPH35_032012 [Triticum aestivum]
MAASSGGSRANPRTGWWWRRCNGLAKMESWQATSGRPPLCGVVSDWALSMARLGSLRRSGSGRCKPAFGVGVGSCGRSWAMPEVRGGCSLLFRLGVGAVAGFLLVVQPVVGPQLCPFPGGVVMCVCADENLAWLMSGRR